ncbi:MAG: hydrogenase iron-sulfur subunit [Candidatus Lokiarchaeota archaeon]|nr:hydrogenase iron-sulfur subunit [Candidatus Lokiarchaeota archaeon]MBD3337496.1 hydrogenase iron-sulfur subunit [Candidatus Lokiarchaeota archaeon]
MVEGDEKTDIYSILSHEFRRDILLLLEKEGYIQYTDLLNKLNLDSTGQLNFHLKKLGSLIGKDNKSYFLTQDGKRIIKILNLNKRILSGEDIEYLKSKGSAINRVGVIICNCNTEISNIVNIHSLHNYVSKLKRVVSVKIFENLCQEKNLEKINDWVKENFLNKVVIAACSPKTHQNIFERLFKGVIDSANIEIANIREQCCWVHDSTSSQINHLNALNKAELLIEAAVERVSLQKEIKIKKVEVEKTCAVIGGGIGGMTVALNITKAGFKVYLIEKAPTLGGKVARWHRIYGMGDCSICFVSELIGELVKEKNIEIFTNTEIESVSGEVGHFTLNLIKRPRYVDEDKCTGCKQCIDVCGIEKTNEYEFGLGIRKIIHLPFQNCYPYLPLIKEEDIKDCINCGICRRTCLNKAIDFNQESEKIKIIVGAKVIAIGSNLYSHLEEYHYDPKNDIITSPEFERILASDGITQGKILKLSNMKPPKAISIIQDVGPRNYENEYSDILALKYLNCIKLKNPKCEVNIFCDLKRIKNNQQLLLKSVDPRFLYAKEIKVEHRENGNVIIADSVEFPSDLIILNINAIPNEDLRELRKILDFTLDDTGFMSEETLASGIYGVGSIFGPLSYQSTKSTANYVALKVISLLSNDYLLEESTGVEINEEKCGLCGLCVQCCPFNSLVIEKEKIHVDKFKCKGCGTCVSICPTNAIEMNINTSEKILKTIETYSKFQEHPKIIAFCCQSCGYAAADDAGLKKIFYYPNIFIVKVPCTGRVDTNFILKSFKLGFDGVMIIGCRNDACRYIDGIDKAKKRVRLLKKIFGPKMEKRLFLENMNAVEGQKFAKIVNKFYQSLKEERNIEA